MATFIVPEMSFRKYQSRAKQFAEYEDGNYPFLGLAEEVGEFLGIMAKTARGDDIDTRYGSKEACRGHILKEAGDILWQLSMCLDELGLSLQDAADMNIRKLTDRKARGVIKGAGDER